LEARVIQDGAQAERATDTVARKTGNQDALERFRD